MPSERARSAIITVVTVIWAANFAAGLLIETYEPDQSINTIFMAIVGGLFALGVKDNDDDNSSTSASRDAPARPRPRRERDRIDDA